MKYRIRFSAQDRKYYVQKKKLLFWSHVREWFDLGYGMDASTFVQFDTLAEARMFISKLIAKDKRKQEKDIFINYP